MKTKTFEINGEDVEMAILTGIPSDEEYDELKKAGFSTAYAHVDDSGNDYWDLSIYFPREDCTVSHETFQEYFLW